jgi:hypothetical protein
MDPEYGAAVLTPFATEFIAPFEAVAREHAHCPLSLGAAMERRRMPTGIPTDMPTDIPTDILVESSSTNMEWACESQTRSITLRLGLPPLLKALLPKAGAGTGGDGASADGRGTLIELEEDSLLDHAQGVLHVRTRNRTFAHVAVATKYSTFRRSASMPHGVTTYSEHSTLQTSTGGQSVLVARAIDALVKDRFDRMSTACIRIFRERLAAAAGAAGGGGAGAANAAPGGSPDFDGDFDDMLDFRRNNPVHPMALSECL